MLKPESTLEELVQLGIKDSALAPQTLVILFETLGKQTQCVIETIISPID